MTNVAASRTPITILLADDDEDDRELTQRALDAAHTSYELREVRDGEELMAYLRHHGDYSAPTAAPRPNLLLLDLRMPRKNGFECLVEMRRDPALRGIPVVILTTSHAQDDVRLGYDLGVNSFIVKPSTFPELVSAMRALGQYWFEIVALPPNVLPA